MRVKTIILATNQEKQMKSNKATVLHQILGKPLIGHTIDVLRDINVENICVLVGEEDEEIQKALDKGGEYVFQKESSVREIANLVGNQGDVIVLSGDTPLITSLSVERLLAFHHKDDNGVTILSTQLNKSEAYGEVYVFKSKILQNALLQVDNNQQTIFNLQDIVNRLSNDGYKVNTMKVADVSELLMVNSRSQLALCTKMMREKINEKHMENGVTLEDPANTYIGPEVVIGYDTIVEPNCTLRGKTTIGMDCFIGNGTNIEDSQICNGVHIENSHIHESFIDDHAHLGPFAYIRPHSKIGKYVKIGDFVEIKNASIGDHTKVSHLTYVGDADVGKHVNFGCGTVLVNYDGIHKHRSTIEDHAFIGCNTNLVSPVHIGERAFTAAGSTITNDVPRESLGISRVRQVNKEGWVAYKYPKK